MLAPLDPGPSSLVHVDGTLYFTSGTALWRTDGTACNTTRITDIGTFAPSFTSVQGTLLFLVEGALWQSDGTADGTGSVSIAAGYLPFRPRFPWSDLAVVNDTLVFSAFDERIGREPWAVRLCGELLACTPPPGPTSSSCDADDPPPPDDEPCEGPGSVGCAVDEPAPPPPCVGQSVPPRLTQRLARAGSLLERAFRVATNPRRSRVLTKKAIRHLRIADRMLAAGTDAGVSPDCTAALAQVVQVARARAERGLGE